jgi:acetyl esterase
MSLVELVDAMAALEPDSQRLVDWAAKSRRASFVQLGASSARIEYAKACRQLDLPLAQLTTVIDGFIEREEQNKDVPPLRYRLVCPLELSWAQPTAALLYFHGGGFTVGSIDTHDSFCRQLALGAGIAVLSVDYRLAPEHRFPAAVEDAFTAQRWFFRNAHLLGFDDANLFVGGDSAGGTLAAACAIQARSEGFSWAKQFLIYPGLGATQSSQSRKKFGQGYLLDNSTIDWFFDGYIPNAKDRLDWRFAPLLAQDHSGLAPAWIGLAQFDPVFDDGVSYHEVLLSRGVHSELEIFTGLLHGCMQHAGFSKRAQAAQQMVVNAIRASLVET